MIHLLKTWPEAFDAVMIYVLGAFAGLWAVGVVLAAMVVTNIDVRVRGRTIESGAARAAFVVMSCLFWPVTLWLSLSGHVNVKGDEDD